MDKVEYIVEFQSNASSTNKDDESEGDHRSMVTRTRLDAVASSGPSADAWDKTAKRHSTAQHPDIGRTSKDVGTHGSNSLKMSLAEKLKQRMRQGLDESGEWRHVLARVVA